MNKLHQIYITDDTSSPLPEYTKKCIEILKKKYSDFEYTLYNDEMIVSLLEINFDKDVLDSYRKLKPYAYKADLARYCILYLYGGLYVDLNILFAERVRLLEELDFYAFRDLDVIKNDYSRVYNGIIWAKPGSKILKSGIDLIVKNCKNNFYGKTPSHPTGPVVLGQAVSAHYQEIQNNPDGSFVLITNNDPKNLRYGFILDGKSLVAVWKYKDGIDLLNTKTIGFNNWDDYRQRWLNKDVYNTSLRNDLE